MFSYRHAFHCGNHADVLKHTALLAVLNYMTEKAVGITVFPKATAKAPHLL